MAKNVSDERLHQSCGEDNSFGGWTKVNDGDGRFHMEPSDDK